MKSSGLNTIELDIKDENGDIGFPVNVPLARQVGAAKHYYNVAAGDRQDPRGRAVPDRAGRHLRGSPALGRRALARDPAARRVTLAQRRGLGWTNPYDKRVWKYNVDIAVAGSEARLRRDPVRLRPLPERRRHQPDRLSGPEDTTDGLDDPAVPQVRPRTAEAAGRPALGRRLRALRDARTSASRSSRGGSHRSSTRSTRWSTRRTTSPASTASSTQIRVRARRSLTRCATSATSFGAARRS